MIQSSRILRLNNHLGLHMRPAAEIVRIAYLYDADIYVYKGAHHANAKSIFELICLGITSDENFEITAHGHEADTALDAISGFLDTYQDVEFLSDMKSEGGMDFFAA